MNQEISTKTVTCAVCKKEIPESEAVKRLRGAVLVCKDCDHKEKAKHKEGEVCEFC